VGTASGDDTAYESLPSVVELASPHVITASGRVHFAHWPHPARAQRLRPSSHELGSAGVRWAHLPRGNSGHVRPRACHVYEPTLQYRLNTLGQWGTGTSDNNAESGENNGSVKSERFSRRAPQMNLVGCRQRRPGNGSRGGPSGEQPGRVTIFKYARQRLGSNAKGLSDSRHPFRRVTKRVGLLMGRSHEGKDRPTLGKCWPLFQPGGYAPKFLL
jgi:hypothetical protein